MADDFSTNEEGLNSPANDAAAITPNDSTDLSKTTRGLYIGGDGDVKVNMANTGTAVVFAGAKAGSILPIRATRVYSTDTTATNIVGLW